MLFSSTEFVFLFLPLLLLAYFWLNAKKFVVASKIVLVLASLFFYAYWNPIYLPLILASVFFNYFFGRLLAKKRKKSILTIGILGNVFLLGYFKYADFFIENYNFIFSANTPLLHIVLPLAISYFTFQQIAFLVDSFRGLTKEYNFLNYSLFIMFFPQTLMGPIVHHKDLIPQFQNKFKTFFKWRNIAFGIFLFAIGLAKKTLLGDPLTNYAQEAFNNAQSLTMLQAWYAGLSFTLSYYFDLSGYADMALGVAKMFNIDLPINFNSPYKARNFAQYWQRWHITLSRFLSDYVYKSLGGNKKIAYVMYLNILITFFVSGVWHGAGWTFVVWGILNGIFVVMAHMMKKAKIKLNFFLAWGLMFLGIILTRILFVSNNFADAWYVVCTLFNPAKYVSLDFSNLDVLAQTAYILLGLIIVLFFKNSMQMAAKFKPSFWSAFYTSILLLASFSTFSNSQEFLYFQF